MSKPLIVLVTGATSGIGKALAIQLSGLGHRVYAAGRRVAELDAAAKANPLLMPIRLDVTDRASLAEARERILRETDGYGVDVLVNNAGYGQLGPVDGVPEDLIRAQYETNVFGLIAVTRAFVHEMRERRKGRVINVSSIGGRVSFPFFGVYSSTKFAVEALSDSMRGELGLFGIDVSVIEPGYVRTGFTDTSMRLLSDAVAGTPYAPLLGRASEVIARFEATGVAPEVLGDAIARVVLAKRPPARVVAPWHARFGLLATWLPPRVADFLVRTALGLNIPAIGPVPTAA